jgi:hypothetical protein
VTLGQGSPYPEFAQLVSGGDEQSGEEKDHSAPFYRVGLSLGSFASLALHVMHRIA